jgi:hypothetical protein
LDVEFEMKDLRMMHYFLGCKAMATPMVSNLKLLQDTTLETVDVTLYRQMVGSLMNLTNTRLDICFVVNTLSQYMEHPR